jgi:ketosteroid isomerase-like protein
MPVKHVVAALMMVVFSSSAKAQDMSQIEIATKYYQALYSGEHDTVREVAAPDMIFEDPSAPEEFGIPAQLNELEAFLEFMSSNTPDQAETTVVNSFVSNDRVVLMITSQGVLPAAAVGGDEGFVSFATQGVTVLHVIDGKVVRHTDYYDYPGLSASFSPVE